MLRNQICWRFRESELLCTDTYILILPHILHDLDSVRANIIIIKYPTKNIIIIINFANIYATNYNKQ